ncbi:MAG TPA: TAT-variant-translocated molybdopterin oxidoreductase [Trueperaceae bacterium]
MLDLSPMSDPIDITTIRERLKSQKGKAYWRSLDELADTEEFRSFLHKEFPRQAAPIEGSLHRRDFLKLLGASLALAGLTACARPVTPSEKIMPYVQQPEEIIPGRPLYYATAISHGGYGEGLLVESHQGRPTKVEGNPDHPASLGATGPTAQASVLTLYDPERSQSVMHEGDESSWEEFVAALEDALAQSGNGAGVRLLTESVTSPTLSAQISRLVELYPEARWYQFDASRSDELFEGTRIAFGQPLMPVFDFSATDVVVSFEANFADDFPGRLAYARAFANRRRVHEANDDPGRFYAFESTPTPTGSLADHRLPLSPGEIGDLLCVIAQRLGVPAPRRELPARVPEPLLEALLDDLNEANGRSLLVAGQFLPAQLQALVHAINDALGNTGSTVRYLEPADTEPTSGVGSLIELTEAMEGGDVSTLLIIGSNPVYTAPGSVDFAAALERVPFSAHLGLYYDETAELCSWHVPQAHYLETWSDIRAFDGTVTIMQPLISTFYGGRSEHELLATALGEPDARSYDIVREYWGSRVEGSFDEFWRQAVYRGALPNSGSAEAQASLQSFEVDLPEAGTGLTVAFRPDPSIGDGRWSNNGWLQELPKPFTKLTWDNAAMFAPATAEELGLTTGDLVTLTVEGRSVEAPVWILPGQAPGTVTVHLGYGRRRAGQIGSEIGFDANELRPASGAWQAPVEVSRAAGRYPLVSTQPHHNLEGTGEERHIIRAGTLAQLREQPEHPHFVHPVEHPESDLYPDFVYDSYAWGMVIDMNVCTGCNACVVACQAENNIPIVGKDQVAVGREMHWLRIDNYHAGPIDDPEYFHQPMLCQHCEKAPCEPVCPVGATVHDEMGLNVMVYNRCVGTRYCSNNCPYKVRRFNFLQYAELPGDASERSLQYNPDVTVRSRGVMEKCTFCVQRIAKARIDAETEDRRIADGEVVTACQAACPTEAIVFGDLNNQGSTVNELKRSPLNYKLLEELNTQPRNTYLARVKNPHPSLVAEEVGAG